MDRIVSTVPKSRLREPAVIEMALAGPVEVTTGTDSEALVLLPRSEFRASSQVSALTELFLRLRAAIGIPNPPHVLFGEAAFLADWEPSEQHRFLDAFAAALAESLRINDPAPALILLDAYVRVSSLPPVTDPQVTGEIEASAAETVAARITRRT